MSLLCVFLSFFFFYSAFSLCGENCSFFVCVLAINAHVDDPRCQIQENGKCQQFYPQTNQHVSRYVLYLCIVFRLDRENLYCFFWVFGVCVCVLFCFVASFIATIFALHIQRNVFFVCVCLSKKSISRLSCRCLSVSPAFSHWFSVVQLVHSVSASLHSTLSCR